jgi:hypothetical protein
MPDPFRSPKVLVEFSRTPCQIPALKRVAVRNDFCGAYKRRLLTGTIIPEEEALFAGTLRLHNSFMERPVFQLSLAGLLGLVACIALNFWLFRLGVLWGILGLNVTKHVAIAFLCQSLGVDRSTAPAPVRASSNPSPQMPLS